MASEMAALIGVRLREARKTRGFTQKQLGNLLPGVVGGDQVSKWERGEHRPHDDTLEHLARVLEVDFSYFLAPASRTETPSPFAAADSDADRLTSVEQELAELRGSITAIQDALVQLAAANLRPPQEPPASGAADHP